MYKTPPDVGDADYVSMELHHEPCTSRLSSYRATSCVVGSVTAIAASALMALAMVSGAGVPDIGAASLPAIAADAMPDTTSSNINGDCNCHGSNGAVCCCCSHCACSSHGASAMQKVRNISSSQGGNWDIDVGGAGTAGGGYCQSNDQCVCCSSCECTGPGTSVKHSNVTVKGNCNGVSNCNGELPARRRLSARSHSMAVAHLKRRQ
jgi:hypothetical protein